MYYEIIDHITKSITSGTQKAESNLDNLRIEKLVNFWKKSPTWLITFNYDILIEKMLEKYYSHDNWYNYWNLPLIDISDRSNSDTGMIWESTGETSRRPEIILSKLHGSINWYRSKHNPSANEPIYYDGKQSYNNHIRTNMKCLKPFIIPPSIEKSSFLNHDILNVIWELAKNQLSGDSKLYIIGYSFPVTDVYINLLFDICMNKSKEIIIVNSDNSDTFKNRMNEYFRKYGIVPDLKYVKKENAINDFIDEIKAHRRTKLTRGVRSTSLGLAAHCAKRHATSNKQDVI